MESAGRCQLQHVSLSQPTGGRHLLIMARPDLGLADWPKRLAVLAAARGHPPDLNGTGAAVDRIVDEMAPGLTERRGIGAVTAAQAIVSFCSVSRTSRADRRRSRWS